MVLLRTSEAILAVLVGEYIKPRNESHFSLVKLLVLTLQAATLLPISNGAIDSYNAHQRSSPYETDRHATYREQPNGGGVSIISNNLPYQFEQADNRRSYNQRPLVQHENEQDFYPPQRSDSSRRARIRGSVVSSNRQHENSQQNISPSRTANGGRQSQFGQRSSTKPSLSIVYGTDQELTDSKSNYCTDARTQLCKNGGICIPIHRGRSYECDCASTQHYGQHCELRKFLLCRWSTVDH